MKTKQQITAGVRTWAKWWIEKRREKLENQLSESMSINPFLMPFLFDYHNLDSLDDLAELTMASHLMTGHNTGFGKLIDEKLLPNVFDAKKLDKAYRQNNSPFSKSCFDEIDHIITRHDGKKELLSLKAGRWTIQLTMAVQLNASFKEILESHPLVADNIVVGVFYGKEDDLTDKYDILRGINRGATHDVTDLTKDVHVYAGRNFWSWLNEGEEKTQEWVLDGIISALEEENIHDTAERLLNEFKENVANKYKSIIDDDGNPQWSELLRKING